MVSENEPIEPDHIVNCFMCGEPVNITSLPEVKMGYVECPTCQCLVDQEGNAYPPLGTDHEHYE